MAVKIDIKPGSQISQDKNGIRAVRTALISGVTGNSDEVLNNALNDASMPNIGDAHPVITGITLQSIQIAPAGGTQYQAALNYFDDPTSATGQAAASVSIDASVATETTKKDINGDTLSYRIRAAKTGSFVTESQIFEAEVDRPRRVLTFTYTSTAIPFADIDTYQGKVNAAPWNGYAAKKLLCSSISVSEKGNEYELRWVFVYNELSWQFDAALTGSNYTIPATDHLTDPSTGIDLYDLNKKFDVYETADFSALAFDLGVEYAEISGTVAQYPHITEADIVAGGDTLIITLYGGETWVAAGATFDAQRQAIIDGLVSNKSEADGWNAELALARILQPADVVRTSSTLVTLTFDVDTLYAITEPENIYITIPAAALVNSATAITPLTKYFKIQGAA